MACFEAAASAVGWLRCLQRPPLSLLRRPPYAARRSLCAASSHGVPEQRQRKVPMLGGCTRVASVLSIHERHGRRFEPQDYAAALHQMGRIVRRSSNESKWMRRNGGSSLGPLCAELVGSLPHFNFKQVAGAAHGLAVLHAETGWAPAGEVWHAVAQPVS
eukprot:2201808-Prymnesium_polylepis.1